MHVICLASRYYFPCVGLLLLYCFQATSVIVLQWSCQQCASCWGQNGAWEVLNPDMSHIKGLKISRGFLYSSFPHVFPLLSVFFSIWWNGGPGQYINYDLYFNQSKAWCIYVEGVRDIWVAIGRRPCLWSYIPGHRGKTPAVSSFLLLCFSTAGRGCVHFRSLCLLILCDCGMRGLKHFCKDTWAKEYRCWTRFLSKTTLPVQKLLQQ